MRNNLLGTTALITASAAAASSAQAEGGIKLGLSDQAAVEQDGEGKNFPVQADNDYNHGMSVGLNFVESFGGVDVAIAGGYNRASGPQDDFVVLDPSAGLDGNGAQIPVRTINRRDINQISAGINIGYAGFLATASYANELDGRMNATSSAFTTSDFSTRGPASSALPANFPSGTFMLTPDTYTSGVDSTEGYAFEASLNYVVGPWHFQGLYWHSQVEGDIPKSDDDIVDAGQLIVQNKVGPGIDANLTGMYANYDGENGLDNQGFTGIVGLDFSFLSRRYCLHKATPLESERSGRSSEHKPNPGRGGKA